MWTPTRWQKEELIDQFDHSPEAFRRSFEDIRWVNRFLGGTAVVRKRLAPLVRDESVSLLDVGVGSADIPLAIVDWAARRGVRANVVGIDPNDKVLLFAREAAQQRDNIRLVKAAAPRLPFADNSFDFALSSLTFHHFSHDLAVETLREMHRIARRAVIINDLRRGYLPAALIWLVTRALRMHPLTRHDGPLSVMRAYTPSEYLQLAQEAGLPNAKVWKHPFWRAALVITKETT